MLFLLLFLFLLETVLSLQIDGLVEGQVFLFWLLLYILQFCLEVVWLMRTKLELGLGWGLFKLSSWYVELFTVQLGSRLLIGDCGYKIISYHYCILLDLNMLQRRCRLSQQIGVETGC